MNFQARRPVWKPRRITFGSCTFVCCPRRFPTRNFAKRRINTRNEWNDEKWVRTINDNLKRTCLRSFAIPSTAPLDRARVHYVFVSTIITCSIFGTKWLLEWVTNTGEENVILVSSATRKTIRTTGFVSALRVGWQARRRYWTDRRRARARGKNVVCWWRWRRLISHVLCVRFRQRRR